MPVRKMNLQSVWHVNPVVCWLGREANGVLPSDLQEGDGVPKNLLFPTLSVGLRGCYSSSKPCLAETLSLSQLQIVSHSLLFNKHQAPKTVQSVIGNSSCRARKRVCSSTFPRKASLISQQQLQWPSFLRIVYSDKQLAACGFFI